MLLRWYQMVNNILKVITKHNEEFLLEFEIQEAPRTVQRPASLLGCERFKTNINKTKLIL
jgi:hypothetical protein